MLIGLAKIADLMVSDLQVHLFLIFTFALWGVWGYKLWLSSSYKPIEGTFEGTVSVLIPTFHEEEQHLKDSIVQALKHEPFEIIVIVDEREAHVQDKIHEWFGSKVRTIIAPPGKRIAVARAVQAARGDVIMVTASDARMEPDTMRNLTAAFTDPEVGGVCGYTRAIIQSNSLASLTFFWITEMRAKLTYRALGSRRQVQVLDGECFAVRREYWASVIDRYLNQRFMSVTPVSGDDGWITTLLLEDGWKTAYQENAVMHTYTPLTMHELITQQLRWTRNSVRRSWYVLSRGIAFRIGMPYTVHTITNMVKTPFFALLVIIASGRSLGLWDFGGGIQWMETYSDSPVVSMLSGSVAGIGAFLIGVSLTKALRALPRYQRRTFITDILLMPVYALLGLFVLMPLRMYGTLTARRITWGTRGANKSGAAGDVLSKIGTISALAVSLTIPIALLILLGIMSLSMLPVSVALASGPMGHSWDWEY
ncbi:MAG: glycosyltransferase [Gammaproteobacteria bacterium]|nr:glycosyltransferase [Gammaproteobacteria bacterium]